MPLLSLLRLVFALLSLAVLAAAGYFLWTWWEGRTVLDIAGRSHLVREDWRLWLGSGMLVWSAFGRLAVLFLVAHRDAAPSRARRGPGEAARLHRPDGEVIYLEELGPANAPRIILTHGWGLDSTIWWYAKTALARRFRVVVWDLPGLGASRRGRQRIDLERFADGLAAVLKHTGTRPALLVGHSIGGMTVQTLLARGRAVRPHVAGAVLLNTTYTNPLRTMVASGFFQALRRPVLEPMLRLAIWLQPLVWVLAWQSYASGSAHLANRFGFGRFVTRSQLDHVCLLAARNSPAAQARGNLAMFRWDGTDKLRSLDVPLLVIGGDLDVITKLEASERIARSAPRARLEVVSGVNHMGLLERAEVYHQHVAAFADDLLESKSGNQAAAPHHPA